MLLAGSLPAIAHFPILTPAVVIILRQRVVLQAVIGRRPTAAGRVCLRVLTRPGKGRYHLSPIAASDSRHNLSPGTTLRRGAPGRVCLRALARRLADFGGMWYRRCPQ